MGCYCSKSDTQDHQTPVQNIEQREEVNTALDKNLRIPAKKMKQIPEDFFRKQSSSRSSSQGPDRFSVTDRIRGMTVSVSRSYERDPCILLQKDCCILMETSDSPILLSDVSTPPACHGSSVKYRCYLYE